jgi:hypothetical protein
LHRQQLPQSDDIGFYECDLYRGLPLAISLALTAIAYFIMLYFLEKKQKYNTNIQFLWKKISNPLLKKRTQ